MNFIFSSTDPKKEQSEEKQKADQEIKARVDAKSRRWGNTRIKY